MSAGIAQLVDLMSRLVESSSEMVEGIRGLRADQMLARSRRLRYTSSQAAKSECLSIRWHRPEQ